MDDLLNTEMHLNEAEAKLSKLRDSVNPVRHLVGGWCTECLRPVLYSLLLVDVVLPLLANVYGRN